MVQDKKKVDPRLADIDINEMGFGADLSLWKFSKQPECVVGEEEVKKTVDYLKNVLNWTTPVMKPFSKLQQMFIIWYDRDSTAKVNELINTIIQSAKDQYYNPHTKEHGDTIRGPVVYFDHEKMLDKTYGSTPINQMLAIIMAGAEIIKNPGLVKSRQWEHNPMNGLGLEGDGEFMRKKMFELIQLMLEERVCDKVKGKQICKHCKKARKQWNSINHEKSMEMGSQMWRDDPANFFEKCPVKDKAVDRVSE